MTVGADNVPISKGFSSVKFLPGLASLALAAPLLVSTSPATAGSTAACPQHPLTTLAGRTSPSLAATSPNGRFQVGSAEKADGTRTAVRWTDGVPAELVPASSEAVDVNDAGMAVVTTSDDDGRTRNWRFRQGQLEPLPVPAGYAMAWAVAISNYRGQIAGMVADANGWNIRPVVWDVANQPRVFASAPGYNETRVSDIDDDGTVVGTVVDLDIQNATFRSQKAAYWLLDGTAKTLPGSSVEAFGEAHAVRNGVAAGTDANQVVTWRLGANAPGAPIAAGGSVSGVNSRGSVVYGSTIVHVYQPGTGIRQLAMQDLGGASGVSAVGITDNDQVYGTDNRHGQLVRWNCSPELP